MNGDPPPPTELVYWPSLGATGEFSGIFGSSEPGDCCATFVLPMVRPPAAAIRDLLVLRGLGDLEKFRGPVRGQKRAKNSKKWIFGSWGPFWARRPPTKFVCGPSEPCLGSHVSPGSEIRALWGGLGVISSVGDRFCLLGTQPTKNCFSRNLAAPGSFWDCFGSVELQSQCATFLL